MEWASVPGNWAWMAAALAAVTGGGLLLARLYRAANNGTEAAITGLLTLLIPAAVAARLAPEGVRSALAAGAALGLLLVLGGGVVALTRRSTRERENR